MRIKKETKNTIIIDKSEFIAYLARATDEAQARDYIASIRKIHSDATHVCTAFVCGSNNQIQRSSDDGEPSGTAGAPMLQALINSHITDAVVCVVRYFGGIKLGAGGLIRAYSSSVSNVIKVAPKTNLVTLASYQVSFSYDLSSKLTHYLESKTQVQSKDFGLNITYQVLTNDQNFENNINELASGKAIIKHLPDQEIEVDVE